MTLGTTIYNFEIALSDLNRQVYEQLSFKVSMHPSESMQYLLTRVLAYCIEYCPGLEFSKGLSDSESPALWVHDLTGKLIAWIEVGAPSAERLHRASKKVERVAIYTYKNPELVLQQYVGERIQNSASILLHSIDPGFLSQLERQIAKRNTIELSLSEGQIYLEIAGNNLITTIQSQGLL